MPTRIPWHVIASDSQIYPGRNDLDWDGESKRIIAVGDGREKSVTFIPIHFDMRIDILKFRFHSNEDLGMHS
jgi:hypothetical protein